MTDNIGKYLRKLANLVQRRRAENALEKAVFSVDECGDITGYNCTWLITGSAAFEKHLKEKHPEGEYR